MNRCIHLFFCLVAMQCLVACGGSSSIDTSWETAKSADGTYQVAWRVVGGLIPRADPFDVEIRILDAQGKPADVECTIDAEMPEHGHGMNVVAEMQRRGTGDFLAKGMLLHMPGRWSIMIDATHGAVTERAQFLYLMP
ncbi:MAG: hypothetical protein EXS10_03805 [Phycisphaerales bacterium]|nr:hypothetical protein [Phycisphaerales bacterium]